MGMGIGNLRLMEWDVGFGLGLYEFCMLELDVYR